VVSRGWVVETPVGLADLGPTLAGLLGRPFVPTEPPLDGRDLSPALAARRQPEPSDLYAESRYPATFGWQPLAAVRRGHRKLVVAPRSELYDLARDPGEAENLVEREQELAGELAARLAALAAGERQAATPQLDAEARAKLASLGYIAGGIGWGPDSGGRDPKDMVGLFRAFEEAHWALVAGRASEARPALERLAEADAGNPVFVAELAEACRRTGAYDRAVELYRQALALNPADREARYNLAITLQEAGRLTEAVVALNTAITLDPGRPEAHNALGIALMLRGDAAGAREQFARAVALDPRDARAANNLGNALRALEENSAAEQAYRRAAQLDARYADPHNGLGTLLVQGGKPIAAVAAFDRALALAPALHEARLNRAIALELAGDRAAAIAGYREFLGRSAGDPQFAAQREAARRLLARLEEGKGS